MGFWKQLADKNNWIPRPQNPGGYNQNTVQQTPQYQRQSTPSSAKPVSSVGIDLGQERGDIISWIGEDPTRSEVKDGLRIDYYKDPNVKIVFPHDSGYDFRDGDNDDFYAPAWLIEYRDKNCGVKLGEYELIGLDSSLIPYMSEKLGLGEKKPASNNKLHWFPDANLALKVENRKISSVIEYDPDELRSLMRVM